MQLLKFQSSKYGSNFVCEKVPFCKSSHKYRQCEYVSFLTSKRARIEVTKKQLHEQAEIFTQNNLVHEKSVNT